MYGNFEAATTSYRSMFKHSLLVDFYLLALLNVMNALLFEERIMLFLNALLDFNQDNSGK